MSTTLKFENISKHYHINSGQSSLREALISLPKRLVKQNSHSRDNAGHWALKDVSFDLEQGNVLGVIGSNGAGKTTTLKILCGVTKPTSGFVQIKGRVSALIELGAGFHQDLTGRENIFLNGAILGLSRKEINSKFDSIVAFAELEKFIDTPIKRYSSGMYARLGFAVAAHVDPDILLVDEVLAVGDINFQKKCFDFIRDFVTGGSTTVFVSHNLYALEQLCNLIVWLDKGTLVMMGPTQQVLAAYMQDQDEKLSRISFARNKVDSVLRIREVYLTDKKGLVKSEFNSGEDICVHVEYEALKTINHPYFALAVWDAATRQPIFIASMLVDNFATLKISGKGLIICNFIAPLLMPRTYQVWGEVYGEDSKSILVQWQPLCAFKILDDTQNEYVSGGLRHKWADAPVRVPYTWEIL